MIKTHIEQFLKTLKNGKIKLYNEAGLQFELGYFLRQQGFEIHFEYCIDKLSVPIKEPLKREMDLYVISNKQQYNIEIKFPTNGAYPRRMTQSIIDVFFLQQLVDCGFNAGYFIFITPLKSFFQGTGSENIYSYFRKQRLINEFQFLDIPLFMLKKQKEKEQLSTYFQLGNFALRNKLKIEFDEFSINGSKYYCLC